MDRFYIPLGTKVVINTIEGPRTGTVLSYRDTHLAELNPPSEPNPDKPVLTSIGIPVVTPDMQRIITLYTVQLDAPETWPGLVDESGTVTVHSYIRPIENAN